MDWKDGKYRISVGKNTDPNTDEALREKEQLLRKCAEEKEELERKLIAAREEKKKMDALMKKRVQQLEALEAKNLALEREYHLKTLKIGDFEQKIKMKNLELKEEKNIAASRLQQLESKEREFDLESRRQALKIAEFELKITKKNLELKKEKNLVAMGLKQLKESRRFKQSAKMTDKVELRMEEQLFTSLKRKCEGKKFKDFSIFARLGHSTSRTLFKFYGANCLAYLCALPQSNQILVIKIVNTLQQDTPGVSKNMQSEVEAVSRIPYHPNITTPLHNFIDEVDYSKLPSLPEDVRSNLRSKTYAIIFRYFPKNLHELIRERSNKFGDLEFLLLLEQLLQALCHLLKYKIIHRDLKPDNIFVSQSGRLVVGDFGCCLDCTEFEGYGGNLSIFGARNFNKGGAAHYLAPEILSFKGNAVINYQKNDVFAIGLCAYQMLSSKDPFGDSSNRKQDEYVELKKIRKDISVLVGKMLKVDFEERYSCQEALAECRRLISKIANENKE